MSSIVSNYDLYRKNVADEVQDMSCETGDSVIGECDFDPAKFTQTSGLYQSPNCDEIMDVRTKTDPTAKFASSWEEFVVDEASGEIFLASSNLVGNFYNGFITRFASVNEMDSCVGIDHGLAGCNHIINGPDNLLVAGFDTGFLAIVDKTTLELKKRFPAHDSYITGLVRNRVDGNKVLSCGADKNIRLYDLKDEVLMRNIIGAHIGQVLSICYKPSSDQIFVSCGQDSTVRLWDLRKEKPASRYAELNSVTSASCWSEKEENYIHIGTSDGSVTLYDVRSTSKELFSRTLCLGQVNKLKIIKPGKLAVISETCVLTVVQETTLQELYLGSATHQDTIRDVNTTKDGGVFSIGSQGGEFVQHHGI